VKLRRRVKKDEKVFYFFVRKKFNGNTKTGGAQGIDGYKHINSECTRRNMKVKEELIGNNN